MGLEDHELLLLAGKEYSNLRNASIGNQDYEIRLVTSDNVFLKGKNGPAIYNIYFVAANMEAADKLAKSISDASDAGSMNIIMNIDGKIQDCAEFTEELSGQYKKDIKDTKRFADIYSVRDGAYSLSGGLLFMGAFFTILFLCATVLIIYFKQISEGYDDKERFETLQKVGMDDLEVKKTINKQILVVFFLPLFGALLHVAMVTHMITKILEVLWLYNTNLTILCITASCAIFTVVYISVYCLTTSTYYRIVKW